MHSFVSLPYKGKLEFATSAATSKEGAKPVFCVLDQALALDTPIPTPTGCTTMGALVTGDVIYGSVGPVRVSEAKQVSLEHDCYRVTFSDGTSIVASAGHLWWSKRCGDSYRGPKVRTTEEMLRGEFCVPIAPAQERPDVELAIPPYSLGLGLSGGTRDKRVPEVYLNGSIAQRTQLLQGLMDSAGSCTEAGTCTFVSTEKHLADAVVYLLRSLGQSLPDPKWVVDDRHANGGKYLVDFSPRGRLQPFTLPRKRLRVKQQHTRGPEWVTIKSVVQVPRVPVRCIAVDSDDHLFAAGVGAYLTHNTESWVKSNGGLALAATVRRNLAKTGGSSVEAPNAFLPGEESVSERSAAFYSKILEGKAREAGLLYDHREWPDTTDMTDKESLLAGLAYVYGESADVNGGWVDLERLVGDIWDPDADPQDSRRFFGNQITHATDSWVSQPQMTATSRPLEVVADGEMIALGFDGSRHRSDSVTDATALIGVRISDGLIFPLGIWEQPDGEKDWWAPTLEIDAAVKGAFKRYNVVAFYADPAADWRSFVANWEAAYGAQLKCKVSATHPIEWWMGGQNLTKTVQALKQIHSAIVHQEATHDGSSVLIRHFLNARRRQSRVGLTIAKPYPESPRKIDAAVAATLAWQARLDVISRGVHTQESKKRSSQIRRF
jgi:hypothetical protein